MQNDLKYTVRSREIVDLVNAMKNQSLTISPYFQRNLVWRESHRKDFIDTILKGYPFPQIFLARGSIDVDNMTSSQAVVDGQQRLNSIKEYIDGKLEVHGKYFYQLGSKEKEDFLRYEVAVIDFDLSSNDPKLKEIFRRLNRTFYALSSIEKIASEYSASEFLLVARTLAGEILKVEPSADELMDFPASLDESEVTENEFSHDPGIDPATLEWLTARAEGEYTTLLKTRSVFTPFEFDRKVPLMFTLNVMCTYLQGYYNRNDLVQKLLEENSDVFTEKQVIIDALNAAAFFISELKLSSTSIWYRKANFFTLMVEFSRSAELRSQNADDVSRRLEVFGQNVPPDYSLAAREGVNGRAQRELRANVVRSLIKPPSV
jgi:hypothetical protein